jgi:hypothetical protein
MLGSALLSTTLVFPGMLERRIEVLSVTQQLRRVSYPPKYVRPHPAVART